MAYNSSGGGNCLQTIVYCSNPVRSSSAGLNQPLGIDSFLKEQSVTLSFLMFSFFLIFLYINYCNVFLNT